MDKNFNSFSKNNINSNEFFSDLFEKTYSSNISLIYYIDYLTYKKELIKNMMLKKKPCQRFHNLTLKLQHKKNKDLHLQMH